jgi:hypothetical protein
MDGMKTIQLGKHVKQVIKNNPIYETVEMRIEVLQTISQLESRLAEIERQQQDFVSKQLAKLAFNDERFSYFKSALKL